MLQDAKEAEEKAKAEEAAKKAEAEAAPDAADDDGDDVSAAACSNIVGCVCRCHAAHCTATYAIGTGL